MKKVLFLLVFFVGFGSVSLFAQSVLKVGHIDTRVLLELMPERKKVQDELEKYKLDLEGQIKEMSREWETKFNDYQKNEKNMTDIIKQNKAQELQDIQKRIQDFQQTAQNDLVEKERKLLSPLFEKSQAAIEKVAKEQGYSYILDISGGVVLYHLSANDIMTFVKKELGLSSINPPATKVTPTK